MTSSWSAASGGSRDEDLSRSKDFLGAAFLGFLGAAWGLLKGRKRASPIYQILSDPET